MSNIFISYRRADSGATCDRMYEYLVNHFGKSAVFKDVDSIAKGANFPQILQEAIRQCSVQLVLIGPQWITVSDARGHKRLDDPADFVRLEIESGLKRGIPVIPILVQGATMPIARQLPRSLESLPSLNAAQLRYDPDFPIDVERLCKALERWVPPALGTPAPGFRYIRIAKQLAVKRPDNEYAIEREVIEVEFALDTSPSVARTFALDVSEARFRLFSTPGYVFRVAIDGQPIETLELRMHMPPGEKRLPDVDDQKRAVRRTGEWTINDVTYTAQFRVGVGVRVSITADSHPLLAAGTQAGGFAFFGFSTGSNTTATRSDGTWWPPSIPGA